MRTPIHPRSPQELTSVMNHARAQMGVAVRRDRPQLRETAAADYHGAKLERAIVEALAAAPSLAESHGDRLAALLLDGGAE